MTLGSIRYHRHLARPAAEVWELVGAPERLHDWFPGIVACHVEGTTRTITLGAGLSLPEEILVHDGLQRRFQYRITAPLFRFHRGTIDVIDLGDETCVVVYTTEADPRTMALTIAGGTAGALDALEARFGGVTRADRARPLAATNIPSPAGTDAGRHPGAR